MPKHSDQDSSSIKKALSQSGVRPLKSLGQHFLTDMAIRDTIIESAELSKSDFVIEVGPGLGILTSELARKAGKVVAVEVDRKLALQLRRKLSSYGNIRIINADILKVDLREIVKDTAAYKVVANLPYYITSPILHYFVEAPSKPTLMVTMMQKEVAEAIVGSGGKMTALAVNMHVYSRPRIVAYVPAHSFHPPPKVDSAVVRFDLLPEPAVQVADLDQFLRLVRCGFSSPRKQLRNSLAHGLKISTSDAADILGEAEIEHQRRAEALTLDEWKRVYEVARRSGKMCTC